MVISAKSTVPLAAVLLVSLGSLHFFAYSLNSAQPDTAFRLDSKLALLFVSYYLSWISVFVANFYLMSRYLPLHGTRVLIPLFLVGATLWVPCAAIIDGTLVDIIYQRKLRPISEIVLTASPLSYYTKFLTYCFVFGGIAMLVYYGLYQNTRINMLERERESAEAEFAVAQQKLISLQSQLAPHFLFNCLNMLSGLARMGQRDKLVFAIARLGDLLRFVSEASRKSNIPLSDEIDFVNNYVELQNVRFGEKYAFSMTISGVPSEIECPPFCLHTLVENAYTHSTSRAGQSTDISVRIECTDRLVKFQVINNNPSQEDSSKLGTGLANLHNRLALLYDDEYELSTVNTGELYTATMRLPI